MMLLGLFLAAIGVPLVIVSIAALAVAAEERFPCPCDWCEAQRTKNGHPAGLDL